MSIHQSPIVTITMAIRGTSSWLEEALESVRNQSLKEWRFVGFLDGPNPKARALIEKFGKNFEVQESSQNVGAARARNEIVRGSRSEYIANLDYDDVWPQTHLERIVKIMDSNQDLVLVGSSANVIDEAGIQTQDQRKVPAHFLRTQLLLRNCFVHSSVVYRRRAGLEAGLYNEEIRIAEDYDFWLRLSCIGSIRNLPKEFISYRSHSAQESKTPPTFVEANHVYRSKEKLAKKARIPRFIARLAHQFWLARNQ
jgi:glycosyltransferase involved in cell wall biosynthesis